MVKKLNTEKGITLVALIVTIIVLLILAGVTIPRLSPDNGIIQNAKDAKNQSEVTDLKEQIEIAKKEVEMENYNPNIDDVIEKLVNKGIIEDASKVDKETGTIETKDPQYIIEGMLDEYIVNPIGPGDVAQTTEKDNYTDSNGDKATIPEGFRVSEVAGEQTVEDGLVIKDSRGNEYVWIPCTTDEASSKLKYQRTEWGVEDDGGTRSIKDELELTDPNITYTQSELNNGINAETSQEIVNQINAEKTSVEKYGGFYIGRYEVGNENNIAVIKPNQVPYNTITWSKAYSLAKGIGGGKNAETQLCSSYAWDTAINFIQNNGATNYATSVVGFNENWLSKEIKDKEGNIIKPAGTSQRLNTGLTTAQSNIYDMGGNIAEFTTELNPGTSEPVVHRGGYYTNNDRAGGRWDNPATTALDTYGFRATLFLK